MILKNANVLLFEKNGFVKMDLEIIDRKITRIEENILTENYIDCSNKFITPGLIDIHSHLGVCEEGAGWAGDDCNEYEEAIMPYLESIDAINPFDISIPNALKGGVTTVCTGPGSDSVIGGIFSTISLKSMITDEMIIQRKACMKCSFGENPKSLGKDGGTPHTRMGVAYQFRKAFDSAKEYKRKKELALKNNEYFVKDIGMENMLLVLNKEIPMQAHVHRADDICTALRLAQEYDIDLILAHCTEGHLIKDHLKKFNYPVILGPHLTLRNKVETKNKTWKTAGILAEAGLKVAITTDHDVTPIDALMMCVGLSVKEGLSEIEGYKAVTKNAAEIIGISHLKGDISVGLDADIVIWDREPLDIRSHVEKVFIEGSVVYEKNDL